ncbi:MAG TPA: D-alanyl-D-alanine carboxypeptidase family protein [Candidatus Polarisedimenticolaceae bacterium]|nr:D-alanyl-D-alanine carboxypeptidase family protein [Candidatus Polarisedimenticolaceae bacterium]
MILQIDARAPELKNGKFSSMKHAGGKPAIGALVLLLAWVIVPRPGAAAELKIAAKAALLMNGQTGEILWAHNQDLPLPPASTAKILTALVVLDHSRTSDLVTIPAEAGRVAGSTTQLSAGEKLSVGDLLHAMLLGSGNDAAIALALHTGKSTDKFVEQMNHKAQTLGAVRTRFFNPTGMPHPSQLTTAQDLALITKAALENSELRNIVGKTTYPWRSKRWQGAIENSNKLLSSYDGAIGVKTGNTREAGYCLVAAAQRDGQTYIAVVLSSQEKAVWRDATQLLDFAFKRRSLEAGRASSVR